MDGISFKDFRSVKTASDQNSSTGSKGWQGKIFSKYRFSIAISPTAAPFSCSLTGAIAILPLSGFPLLTVLANHLHFSDNQISSQ